MSRLDVSCCDIGKFLIIGGCVNGEREFFGIDDNFSTAQFVQSRVLV